MKKFTINDKDRADYVQNEESWYYRHKFSRLSMRNFVKENRAEITAAIEKANTPHVKTWRDYASNHGS